MTRRLGRVWRWGGGVYGAVYDNGWQGVGQPLRRRACRPNTGPHPNCHLPYHRSRHHWAIIGSSLGHHSAIIRPSCHHAISHTTAPATAVHTLVGRAAGLATLIWRP